MGFFFLRTARFSLFCEFCERKFSQCAKKELNSFRNKFTIKNYRGDKGIPVMTGEKKRLSTGNRLGMCVITVIVLALLIGMLAQSQTLRAKNAEYEIQKAELEEQIKDEEVRAEEIDDLGKSLNSDEYIEQLARERLGLVYEDDIIFRAAE